MACTNLATDQSKCTSTHKVTLQKVVPSSTVRQLVPTYRSNLCTSRCAISFCPSLQLCSGHCCFWLPEEKEEASIGANAYSSLISDSGRDVNHRQNNCIEPCTTNARLWMVN